MGKFDQMSDDDDKKFSVNLDHFDSKMKMKLSIPQNEHTESLLT